MRLNWTPTPQRRADRITRLTGRNQHTVTLRRLRSDHAGNLHTLTERDRDRAAERDLSAVWRSATRDGARIHTRHLIQDSAEARGLRIHRLRVWSRRVGALLLAVLGTWSTLHVHAGVTAVVHAPAGSAWWWAAWAVEPALITVVALVMIARSVLRSAGGDTDRRATRIMWAALGTSVLLASAAANWTTGASPAFAADVAGHVLGPVGCAIVVHLLVLLDDYVHLADPYADAPSVETLLEGRRVGQTEQQEDTVEPEQLEELFDDEDTSAPASSPLLEHGPTQGPDPFVQHITSPGDDPFTPPAEDQEEIDALFAAIVNPPLPEEPVYLPAPAPGTPRWAAAVDAYAESVRAGAPISGREACRIARVSPDNRRFAKRVQDAAREDTRRSWPEIPFAGE